MVLCYGILLNSEEVRGRDRQKYTDLSTMTPPAPPARLCL